MSDKKNAYFKMIKLHNRNYKVSYEVTFSMQFFINWFKEKPILMTLWF